MKTRRFKHYPI